MKPAATARALRDLGVGAARTGVLRPPSPPQALRMLRALRHGSGLAALIVAAAGRHPDRAAVIDEDGPLPFGELEARAGAVAGALRAEGVGPGMALAVMCRNHRGLLEALAAGSWLGCDLLLVNTELSAAQLAAVLERERAAAIVHDAEFGERFAEAPPRLVRVLADGEGGAVPTLAELARSAAATPTRREGRVVILTSGTTGLPKGAPRRPSPLGYLGPLAMLLSRGRLRTGEPLLDAPPVFHGFGLAFLGLGLGLGCPVILRRRFDAAESLAAIARHRAGAALFVPAMLQRILALPEEVRRAHEVSSLRTVFAGAAPLAPAVSEAFMDEYGELLFNLYGSTEVGVGAIATPADLRAAPGTIGRPPEGVPVRVLGGGGEPVPPGSVGRLFVGGRLNFAGYSGGGTKESVNGLMNTGDLAHFDREGRLFVDGRQDDMIVSGGENVFPQEVEDVLAEHEAVADSAVVGVEDADFGQRLRAFVVPRPGAAPSAEELIAHVRSRLERYKAPREVVLVDEIPRNATGKLLRRELDAG